MSITLGIAAVMLAILRGQGADPVVQALGTAGIYLICEGIRRLPPSPPSPPDPIGAWG